MNKDSFYTFFTIIFVLILYIYVLTDSLHLFSNLVEKERIVIDVVNQKIFVNVP